MRLATLLGATCAIFTAQLACAADLPTKAPPPPSIPVLYNWNGFYVGAHVGYGWSNIDATTTNLFTGVVDPTLSHDRSGILGGGQVGYNYMVSPNFLIGIEGDIDAAGIQGTSTNCLDATHCSSNDGKNDWFATLRGRIGYVQNNWLIFVTGGAAWVHDTNTRTITVAPPATAVLIGQSATASSTNFGWTVGGGIEYGFARNWSANLEYRYMQFDTSLQYFYSLPQGSRQIDSTDHVNTVRLGVSYHFN